MTSDELAARWTSLRQKLIEGVRPRALQAGLRSPWLAGLAAGVGAFVLGYVLGSRAVRAPAPPPPASHAQADSSEAAPAGESPPAALIRSLAIIGLEALEREIQRRRLSN